MTDYEDLGHTSCPGDPAHRDALTVPATPRGRAWKAEQEAERRGYLRGLEDAARAADDYADKARRKDERSVLAPVHEAAARRVSAAIRQLAKEKPHG